MLQLRMTQPFTTGHRPGVSERRLLLAGLLLLLCASVGFGQAWLWLGLALPAVLAGWPSLMSGKTNV